MLVHQAIGLTQSCLGTRTVHPQFYPKALQRLSREKLLHEGGPCQKRPASLPLLVTFLP